MAGWDDPAHRLDAKRIAELFAEIDWQLGLKRSPGSPPIELLVCGGAALCFQIPERGTGDVDIMYPPMPPELREVIRTLARRNALPPGWMNDALAQFTPYGPDAMSNTLYEGDNLTVRSPDNRYLLGMKIQAARAVDYVDTVWLMADTGLRSASELHKAARTVSDSVGREWTPDRNQRKFVKRSVKLCRRHERAERAAETRRGI